MISHITLGKVLDFRPIFVELFLNKLRSIDWSVSDNVANVDDKCTYFPKQLVYCIGVFPVYYVPVSPKDKPWITPFLCT